MIPVSSCSCLCPIHWSQVLSPEWRCSWNSADRWCSNYIWVINKFIAYKGASYIRGVTVYINCCLKYLELRPDRGISIFVDGSQVIAQLQNIECTIHPNPNPKAALRQETWEIPFDFHILPWQRHIGGRMSLYRCISIKKRKDSLGGPCWHCSSVDRFTCNWNHLQIGG